MFGQIRNSWLKAQRELRSELPGNWELKLITAKMILPKAEKLPFVTKSVNKLNLLNFFLQIAWEIKAIDSQKYQNISLSLNEIGRMLGGWRNKLQNETSARK